MEESFVSFLTMTDFVKVQAINMILLNAAQGHGNIVISDLMRRELSRMMTSPLNFTEIDSKPWLNT